MLQHAQLLKHKILAGLLYGCGLRCMEVRNIRLTDLDFDRRQLHVKQSKGRKDRILPLSEHLIRGLSKYIAAEHPTHWLFTGNGNPEGKGFDGRYSQRGVQWAVKRMATDAGIKKEVSVHTLRHSYACHLLEDGMNIVTLKELMGHAAIETTMEYLHLCQLDDRKMFSPLDTLFAQCARSAK